MTRKRVTKEEKQQRHEWAMRKIDQGVGFSELASLVAETWGCSRRQARRVVTEAHKEWMDLAFGDDNVDQRDLLFQCIARLERTARKAEEAGNYACVIGAVAQMNRMLSLGADTRGFHSHATHAVRRGVDVFTLQSTLGHASSATTGHYVAANPEDSSSLRLG